MNWYNVTFDQYLEVLDIFNDAELDEADRAVKLCDVLFDVDILKLPMSDYGKYISQLSFLNKKMPKAPVLDHYEVNGRKYRLIRDVGDITVAMYFDYKKKCENGSDIRNYADLMSCFFIPEGKEYGEGYPMSQVRDDIGDIPVPVVSEIAGFWRRTFKRYIKVSLLYFRMNLRKMPKAKRKEMKRELRKLQKTTAGVSSLA